MTLITRIRGDSMRWVMTLHKGTIPLEGTTIRYRLGNLETKTKTTYTDIGDDPTKGVAALSYTKTETAALNVFGDNPFEIEWTNAGGTTRKTWKFSVPVRKDVIV